MSPSEPVIAYVCADPGVPVFGRKGGSAHVRSMLVELSRRAGEVHLFASRFGGPVPDELRAVVCHELPCPRGAPPERERGMVAADEVLADQLRRLDEVDLVYQRYSLWSCAALELARARRWPSVLEINAPLLDEQARHRILVDRCGASDRTVRAIRSATAPFAVSSGVAVWSTELSGRRVAVVANGVDPGRFPLERQRIGVTDWGQTPIRHNPAVAALTTAATNPRGLSPTRRPAEDAGEVVVGFVGTFRPWHDLDTVIDAIAAVARLASSPPLRLLLVGDGPGRDSAVSRAEELGVAVESTGSVPAEAVPPLLARMDVGLAIYPPGEQYFSPLKVFEYLAAGVTVVASAVGGLDELLEHGREALLSRPGDEATLVEHLRLACTDAGRREALGRAGRRAARERLSWSQVLDRVLALIPTPEVVT